MRTKAGFGTRSQIDTRFVDDVVAPLAAQVKPPCRMCQDVAKAVIAGLLVVIIVYIFKRYV